jgi:hypothetical protein
MLNVKELVNTLKQIDTKYHYDIFLILKKYDIQYTKNSNGIFFSLEQIDESILKEIENYLQISVVCTDDKQEKLSVEKGDSYLQMTTEDPNEDPKNENNKAISSRYSGNEECENIIKDVLKDDKIKVSKILQDIEKDKHNINKKTAVNKFSMAKKKYAKQNISSIEIHDVSTLLTYEKH